MTPWKLCMAIVSTWMFDIKQRNKFCSKSHFVMMAVVITVHMKGQDLSAWYYSCGYSCGRGFQFTKEHMIRILCAKNVKSENHMWLHLIKFSKTMVVQAPKSLIYI